MQVSSSVQSVNSTVSKPRKASANPFRIREFIEPNAFGTTYYDTQKGDNKDIFKLDINDADKLQQKRREETKVEQERQLRDDLERLNARKAELQGLGGNQFMSELGSLSGQIGTLQSQMANIGSGNIGGMLGFSQTI